MPSVALLWSRLVSLLSVVVFLYTLDQITILLGDFWLLQSLQLEAVFWTNFWMGAKLYVIALLGFTAAAVAPAFLHDLRPTGRSWVIMPGTLLATVVAYALALEYLVFLFGVQNVGFGEADPVFGIDLGFYVFDLPYYWVTWEFTLGAACVFLVSSVTCAYAATRDAAPVAGAGNALAALLGRVATRPTRVAVALVGTVGAIGVWLSRYELLLADNADSSVHTGAAYVDVTGLFSTVNYITVTTLVVLGLTALAVIRLAGLHREVAGSASPAAWSPRRVGLVAFALVAFDFAFVGAVELRDQIFVQPNEPVIQLAYIKRHVDATRRAVRLENIERIEYTPNQPGAPLPDLASLQRAAALRQAPLWPGFVSYLERLLDPQHATRIIQTNGDSMIYGPTLDLFRQEQKLRTYYNFVNVDYTRYTIDGEQQMYVSAIRELPMHAEEPWLSYFGQRFMLFTHGFGMVAAPANEVSADGGLNFVSRDVPSRVDHPRLAVKNERVYYGEGAATISFSNVDQMKELDFPTNQGREEISLPPSETTAVPVDSVWKRAAIGWRSGHLVEFLFSDLITPETRVHLYREPIVRLERIAPFLHFDTNVYAAAADGGLVWLVNALTHSDHYPYSRMGELGDKSDQRTPYLRDTREINYLEDSVKATIDAYTGQVRFYKLSDDPVIATWASIYPELFLPMDRMPEQVREQITYPTHLFHYQFDDLYIYYHMNDPMYFFNQEDMWDDGDEVRGPLLADGDAITFSIEPSVLIMDTGGHLPKSSRPTQFALMMPFTAEVAQNLRAIPIAYQDWPDYGKLSVLEVPKGIYIMGSEQADAVIDQDPAISQQFALWNRRGMEVIRGHTITVPLAKEILFIEPIFLRSRQNPVTQLKRVAVVFRGRVAMAETLDGALRAVYGLIEAESSTRIAATKEKVK